MNSKKATTSSLPRAEKKAIIQSDIPLPKIIDVHTPPSLELLLAFAHARANFFDDAFTTQWWHLMNDEYMWIHPKSARPIDPWPPYFREWRLNRAFFERLRDPERIPAARKSATYSGRKADNFLEASEEIRKDFEDILG